ncbi:MAG: FAD-dependent oxidoreductase [Deltaproteobacteria bacterium]|nr:FAD-dependent oxidoreductase [Deltaproteobacteria bacterium]
MSNTGKLVVIGGGVAGVNAARAARNEYPEAHITLLSKERHPFYNKIALNSYITRKRPLSHMHFYPADSLYEQRIDARLGATVETILPGRHIVALAGGEEVGYDKLVLATGAVPFIPPIPGIDAPEVHTLWSLEDAIRIRESLTEARNVSIIGGGVLGVETAVDLCEMGVRATIIEQQSSVLPLHLDDTSATLYEAFLRESGVRTNLGVSIDRIVQGKKGVTIHTSDGERNEFSLVLLTAGVKPNPALAEAAGIRTNRGLVVDRYMNTSKPDILACGNCVEIDGEPSFLWNPAMAQGQAAGTNAFENKVRFDATPVAIHLKTPKMPLFVIGRSGPAEPGDRVITDRSGSEYRSVCIDAQGRLRSATFLERTEGCYEIEQALMRSRPVSNSLIDGGSIDEIIRELSTRKGDEAYDVRGWVCQMCGFSHEGSSAPEICPVCGVGKDQFKVA